MVTRVEIRPGFWIEVNQKAAERSKVSQVSRDRVTPQERRRIMEDIVARPRSKNIALMDEGVRLSRLFGVNEAARRIGVNVEALKWYKRDQIDAGHIKANARVDRVRMIANMWWEQTGQLSAQQPAMLLDAREFRKSRPRPKAQPCAPQAPSHAARPWDNIAKRRDDSDDSG